MTTTYTLPQYGPSMFSERGNARVRQLVLTLVEAVREGRCSSRRQFLAAIQITVKSIALNHPEVHDTEPETWICEALDNLCEEEGWVSINRGDL